MLSQLQAGREKPAERAENGAGCWLGSAPPAFLAARCWRLDAAGRSVGRSGWELLVAWGGWWPLRGSSVHVSAMCLGEVHLQSTRSARSMQGMLAAWAR